MPDIEVGRYGFRTFRIDPRRRTLLPLMPAGGGMWRGGTCVAVCLDGHPHAAPDMDCTCVIYATTNLASLAVQYPWQTAGVVTVIAAEGPTNVGSEGLRTAAARVVAYWCHPYREFDIVREIFAEECPQATYFTDCDEMAAAYRMPVAAPAQMYPDTAALAYTGVLDPPRPTLRRVWSQITATARLITKPSSRRCCWPPWWLRSLPRGHRR